MNKEKNYKVFIKDLVIETYIGIYPSEKINKQRVRFNISILAKDNIKKCPAFRTFTFIFFRRSRD